jgi:hypothetical protein
MARRAKGSEKRLDKARELPWATLLAAGAIVTGRWRSLSSKERARLRALLGESGGRPGNLTDKQRKELRKLARKLDLKGMGRDLASLRGKGRQR